MSGIKMVAVDMDGTFLRSDNSYDEQRFRRILQRMEAAGAHFVVASGNQYWQLRDFFPGYDDQLSFVSENGAFVMDRGEKVFVGTMDPAAVRTTIDWTYAHPEVDILVCCEQYAYAPRGRMTPEKFDFMGTYYHHLTWIDDLHDIEEPALKFALEVPEAKTSVYYEQLCTNLPAGLVPTTSGHGCIDVIVEGVHKANGLTRLVERWGISPADCAAFGDGGNDLEMLRYVGHPYAVANAAPEVRSAGELCPSHDDDGVLTVLDQLF